MLPYFVSCYVWGGEIKSQLHRIVTFAQIFNYEDRYSNHFTGASGKPI